ncbi:conserved hypothetical protein [Streptomyces viridochromogenes DSM 40736]|uniref:Trypsin-co-occurring domain-containing protein n=1 Tax=Streptomyces viridochromogenes (strain DSM 40736 / JCM 4977 / BCRC 1201 / Tue 494) TaxID=591159 RepID=D9XFF0_STRVT|nr:conserved hypothetical protein [Streptomyces viridochromogenes DSM 40736]
MQAVTRGAGQDLAFRVGPIELEFSVELRQDARAKAGFKAWVVSGDAEAGAARGRTHRVTVTLTPKSGDGREDILVAEKRRSAFPGPGDVSGRIQN